jgi:two-component system, NtrC family, sensor kinase
MRIAVLTLLLIFLQVSNLTAQVNTSPVKDNGNGIPQNIVDKIFQPFFTTKPTGSGTGLGLSLSYDIIKAHGGSLKAESKEGEGSEFGIFLPGNLIS